jgi:hypothetical protein
MHTQNTRDQKFLLTTPEPVAVGLPIEPEDPQSVAFRSGTHDNDHRPWAEHTTAVTIPVGRTWLAAACMSTAEFGAPQKEIPGMNVEEFREFAIGAALLGGFGLLDVMASEEFVGGYPDCPELAALLSLLWCRLDEAFEFVQYQGATPWAREQIAEAQQSSLEGVGDSRGQRGDCAYGDSDL